MEGYGFHGSISCFGSAVGFHLLFSTLSWMSEFSGIVRYLPSGMNQPLPSTCGSRWVEGIPVATTSPAKIYEGRHYYRALKIAANP